MNSHLVEQVDHWTFWSAPCAEWKDYVTGIKDDEAAGYPATGYPEYTLSFLIQPVDVYSDLPCLGRFTTARRVHLNHGTLPYVQEGSLGHATAVTRQIQRLDASLD